MFSDNFILLIPSIFFYKTDIRQQNWQSDTRNYAGAKLQKFEIGPVNPDIFAPRAASLRIVKCTAFAAKKYFLMFHILYSNLLVL